MIKEADMIINFLIAAVLAGAPLVLATVGEIITEKSGNINLGVEGTMYIGAVASLAGAVALVIFSAWNPLKSIFCSIIFGALMIMRLYIAIPGLNPFIYDMCPYIVTSIVIIITSIRKTGKDHIPESLGENYYREER
jgi:hypothetical protein